MHQLSAALGVGIDTMGRFYDATQQRLRLPDDDEDEVWAGEYFPRQFFATQLSIEHLNIYQRGASEQTLCVVSGIFEEEDAAHALLESVQQFAPNAYLQAAEIYMGCMH